MDYTQLSSYNGNNKNRDRRQQNEAGGLFRII